jgi:hypothetical protein
MSTNIAEMQGAMGMQAVQQAPSLGSMSAEEARAVAKVKAQFYVAKTSPRDVNERLNAIKKLCKIAEVAQNSEFSFPRGRTTVRGPNIRIAELIASNWHNFEYGITEINRGQGASLCEAYAIDMESNTAYRMQYVVPHRRDKNDSGGGEGTVDLKTDRDIYEMIANMGSRRVREAILRVIPTFVVEAAMDVCRATKLETDQREPLADRIPKALSAWKDLGVTPAMIAAWLRCPIKDMIEQQYQDLKEIYRTIKANEGRVSDYFEIPTNAPQAQTSAGAAKVEEKSGGESPKQASGAVPASKAGGTADKGSAPKAAGNAAPDAPGNNPPAGVDGSDAGGPPGYEEIDAMIATATTQDHFDEISSLLANNPSLNKTQASALRGKWKAKVANAQLE